MNNGISGADFKESPGTTTLWKVSILKVLTSFPLANTFGRNIFINEGMTISNLQNYHHPGWSSFRMLKRWTIVLQVNMKK